MDFKKLAFERRSVRKFTDRRPDRETIQKLLDITFTAPSSKNVRSTRIAVTEDRQILETVSRMRSRGAGWVKDAPLAFFIMGDESLTDLWRENCAISATVLQLAAQSMGLGSCWIQVFGRPHSDDDPQGETAEQFLHANIPGLPELRIMCVVAVGYPEQQPAPHTVGDDCDKVFYL